jgi:DNA processing protein
VGRVTADERAAWVALAHVAEPADVRLGRLVGQVGVVETVDRIAAGETGLRSGPGLAARLSAYDPGEAQERALRSGARILTPVDHGWPTQLGDLGDGAPCALWVAGAGDLRLLALRSLAIVGARACTMYGEQVAHGWAADLAGAGWTVLSGAAYGIDAAAHRGALAAGGVTIAVVAGGVDVAYPTAHADLLSRIRQEGLIVSESPPGERVRRQRFLSRNRLIASLGRATLVVEAALRSGATSTARDAAAINRPVLAVPGPVTSPTSAGCHRMIREGEALCVVDVADVLAMLDLGSVTCAADDLGEAGRPPASPWDRLSDRERRVLDALPRRGGLRVDEVVRAAGLGPTDVLASLAVLEATGLARCDDGRWRACAAVRGGQVTMEP